MYSHGPRAFASALVGHLCELAQEYSVVLLTDPLPSDYRAILERKDLFPGLERVVEVRALGFSVRELVAGNRRWIRTVGLALDTHRPSVVIGENDMSSLFDMYLMREASDRGIPTLTIQAMGQALDSDVRRLMRVWSVYRDTGEPGILVRQWRRARAATRKLLGHVLVHWLLPWSAGRRSLRGGSSYVTFRGAPGMRYSRLHLAQGESQRRVLVASGVPAERLAILEHPASRVPHAVFFPGPSHGHGEEPATHRRVLVLLGSNATGLSTRDSSLITVAMRRRTRQLALQMICTSLPGWEVAVKAHPTFGTTSAVAAYLGPLSGQVTLIDPAEPVEPLIVHSDVIVDLPSASSSTLVTAVAAFPAKPVIAADLDEDLLGAVYRDWPGIHYVRTLAEFEALLAAIAGERYSKPAPGPDAVAGHGVRVFTTTTDAVRFLLGTRGDDRPPAWSSHSDRQPGAA